MTKYAVSLAGKQYTVILVTPEDNFSIIGHTRYGWLYLQFPAGYSSDEITLDDLIASCSASFRFYTPVADDTSFIVSTADNYTVFVKTA